ncbi:hypothetical protein N5J43_22715 [Pseudomonas nicosulfuronedens]|uniref:Uncharacterized protein n=1 Tax=Pseudomonas nicosulfuronedens TaxID=2571105 RepID=A0A5R9QS22_9PSED|nr:hypothetical protein [Pseudomonas nicosulfuronedens]MDH1012534.1 hypothetical protein [Pseudomonas nicosulfuronedens]MDH1981778.1 hypothetical protein [Pseudomonas nicosulfuronedens]MDH2029977.1 hypothetical protein [Pseudomonas nicosulfuronedens]TLX72722.1 hypothetical protein FAS41_22430 [Pseudomonas nicosulfuronedens]
MSEQSLTLALLLDTVEQALSTRLTEIGAFLRGPLTQTPATLPALALEYAGLLPGRDPGNGQTALICRLQTRILVARDDAQAEALVLRTVAALAVLLRGQNWGLELEPVSFIQAQPELDNSALAACRVWLVEWQQPVLLGETEWPWEDQPPGSLMLGFDPQTGPGHEDDYFDPGAVQ